MYTSSTATRSDGTKNGGDEEHRSETIFPTSGSNKRISDETPDISHNEDPTKKITLDEMKSKESLKTSSENTSFNPTIMANISSTTNISKSSSANNSKGVNTEVSSDSSAHHRISMTEAISRRTSSSKSLTTPVYPTSSRISSAPAAIDSLGCHETSDTLESSRSHITPVTSSSRNSDTSGAKRSSRDSSVSFHNSRSSSTPVPELDLRSAFSENAHVGSKVNGVSTQPHGRLEDNGNGTVFENYRPANTFGHSLNQAKNRLAQNMRSFSGDPPSRSLSSTTPQSSISFKVVAVVEGRGVARGEIGMAYVDLKNPLLVLSQFADTQAYIRLAVQLNILRPVEIILPHTVMESRSKIITRIREMFPEINTVTVLRKYFNETKGLQFIQDLCVPEYKTVEVEASSKYYCLAACAALIKYMEFKQNLSYAHHSLKIVYRTSADTTMISTSTARHLELVTNELGKIEQSLYGVLNHTQTPGGDRLLRANILQPPCDTNTIVTRLDCISELIDNEDLFNDLRSIIGKFMDTEHMLSLCIQIPKEKNVRNAEQKIANVISLKHALDLVKPLHDFLANSRNALFQTYYQALSDVRFQDLREKIGLVIHNDTTWQKGTLNMHMQKCFAVKANINGLLDIARRAYTESVNDVSDIVKQLEKQYDLPLNLAYSSLKGFFIQIQSKAVPDIEKLPSIFLKVNKWKNLISCTTEDIIKLNDRIRESLNEIYIMSDIIIDEVLTEVRGNIACLYNLTEAVSSIDFLLSLTHACTLSDHIRPEFSNVLAIKEGRHPIIEKVIGTTYIPNNTFLCEEMNFIILSGANMSGKTTYLKQVAVLQIMAQIGCYVPAKSASFRIAENILSRMGSSDDIERNYSTFMLQMKEANFILQHATENSLIIMDEVGKGTSLEEGCGLAYAICEELLKTKAFSILSTHFMELTELASVYPNVENYHFRVDYDLSENEGCVCNFSHVLTPGPCKEKHYGVKIAELAALPKQVMQEALTILQNRTESNRNVDDANAIDEERKNEIKIAVHLIHLTQDDMALDERELRDHLRQLKMDWVLTDSSAEHSHSSPSYS